MAYVEIRFTCGKAILEMTRKGAFSDKPLIHEMTIGFCGWGSTQEHIGAANLTSCKHHIWIQEGKQESVIISFSHGNWNLQLKEQFPKKLKVLPQVWTRNVSRALSLLSGLSLSSHFLFFFAKKKTIIWIIWKTIKINFRIHFWQFTFTNWYLRNMLPWWCKLIISHRPNLPVGQPLTCPWASLYIWASILEFSV